MRLDTFFTLWISYGCFAQDISNSFQENVLKEIQFLKTENTNKEFRITSLESKSQEHLTKLEKLSDEVEKLKKAKGQADQIHQQEFQGKSLVSSN